jgi:hypothetical protein
MIKVSANTKDALEGNYKYKSCDDGDYILDLQDIQEIPPVKPHPEITKLIELARESGCSMLWLI